MNLCHPNVLRLYAYFWNERKIFLALEFAPKGDLYKHMRAQDQQKFSEEAFFSEATNCFESKIQRESGTLKYES